MACNGCVGVSYENAYTSNSNEISVSASNLNKIDGSCLCQGEPLMCDQYNPGIVVSLANQTVAANVNKTYAVELDLAGTVSEIIPANLTTPKGLAHVAAVYNCGDKITTHMYLYNVTNVTPAPVAGDPVQTGSWMAEAITTVEAELTDCIDPNGCLG